MHLAFHNCQQTKLTFESLHISVDLRCFGFVCTRVGWYFDYFDCKMIEITCNDRLGKKVRVKCNPDDTIGDLKKLIAAQTGTKSEKIVLKKWYTIYKDPIRLCDCKFIYKNSIYRELSIVEFHAKSKFEYQQNQMK